jgi:hypothetical protein
MFKYSADTFLKSMGQGLVIIILLSSANKIVLDVLFIIFGKSFV